MENNVQDTFFWSRKNITDYLDKNNNTKLSIFLESGISLDEKNFNTIPMRINFTFTDVVQKQKIVTNLTHADIFSIYHKINILIEKRKSSKINHNIFTKNNVNQNFVVDYLFDKGKFFIQIIDSSTISNNIGLYMNKLDIKSLLIIMNNIINKYVDISFNSFQTYENDILKKTVEDFKNQSSNQTNLMFKMLSTLNEINDNLKSNNITPKIQKDVLITEKDIYTSEDISNDDIVDVRYNDDDNDDDEANDDSENEEVTNDFEDEIVEENKDTGFDDIFNNIVESNENKIEKTVEEKKSELIHSEDDIDIPDTAGMFVKKAKKKDSTFNKASMLRPYTCAFLNDKLASHDIMVSALLNINETTNKKSFDVTKIFFMPNLCTNKTYVNYIKNSDQYYTFQYHLIETSREKTRRILNSGITSGNYKAPTSNDKLIPYYDFKFKDNYKITKDNDNEFWNYLVDITTLYIVYNLYCSNLKSINNENSLDMINIEILKQLTMGFIKNIDENSLNDFINDTSILFSRIYTDSNILQDFKNRYSDKSKGGNFAITIQQFVRVLNITTDFIKVFNNTPESHKKYIKNYDALLINDVNELREKILREYNQWEEDNNDNKTNADSEIENLSNLDRNINDDSENVYIDVSKFDNIINQIKKDLKNEISKIKNNSFLNIQNILSTYRETKFNDELKNNFDKLSDDNDYKQKLYEQDDDYFLSLDKVENGDQFLKNVLGHNTYNTLKKQDNNMFLLNLMRS